MHTYKCVQSHIIIIIIIHQHVSVTLVTIIRVSCNKNTINIQIIVKQCVIIPLSITFDILKWNLCSYKLYRYILINVFYIYYMGNIITVELLFVIKGCGPTILIQCTT
jgi:hypothetical protein